MLEFNLLPSINGVPNDRLLKVWNLHESLRCSNALGTNYVIKLEKLRSLNLCTSLRFSCTLSIDWVFEWEEFLSNNFLTSLRTPSTTQICLVVKLEEFLLLSGHFYAWVSSSWSLRSNKVVKCEELRSGCFGTGSSTCSGLRLDNILRLEKLRSLHLCTSLCFPLSWHLVVVLELEEVRSQFSGQYLLLVAHFISIHTINTIHVTYVIGNHRLRDNLPNVLQGVFGIIV